ncbi:MAG: DUF1802 family protein [Elainella sp. Prado103]|nr:DUF1802 family protein [Elainella sp. Prado103]
MTIALKEWAVAIEALMQGEMILLLRKGGIHEQGGQFSIAQPQFWLFPTYEHQKPHLLKSPYCDRVSLVEPGWHPETVSLQAWARVTQVDAITAAEQVAALLSFHIWTETFVAERFKWKPRSPLSLLLLRVYRLSQPLVLPYRSEYGGCKSWIDWHEWISPTEIAAQPVLSESAYQQQVQAIQSAIEVLV